MLNTIPNLTIGDWIFKAAPSILKPEQALQGVCKAFLMLDNPKELHKRLQENEPENHELTVIE